MILENSCVAEKGEPSVDTITKKSSTAEKSEPISHEVVVINKEKSETVCAKLSELRSRILNKQVKKKENENLLQSTEIKSKIIAIPDAETEDSDVVIVYDNEKENWDYDLEITETFGDFTSENRKNSKFDEQVHGKYNEELDDELKILKAQYSDIENKLESATELFSVEDVYKCVSKVKNELNCCMKSLVKLRTKFRNKWLQGKSEISDAQAKPSRTYYHKQYVVKTVETPIDKYKSRAQNCTRLTKNTRCLYEKIESRHSYEYGPETLPEETLKMPHKYWQKPDNFGMSEKGTCKNLHKRKCKLSHFSYEYTKESPVKKIKKCSKKYSSHNGSAYTKETDDGMSERGRNFRSYSSRYANFGGFSKSFTAHREFTFGKSIPRDYTSHSNQMAKLSSPTKNYKRYLYGSCPRKKGSESQRELCKYDKEHEFNDESSETSDISSFSDLESDPIPLDHYYESKYQNEARNAAKSTKRSKKRMDENQYEKDLLSSDSDLSLFEEDQSHPFGKKHHKEAWKSEKKRVSSLVGRQMDLINKCVTRKGDLVKADQDFIPLNITDNRNRKIYLNKEKFKDEIMSSEDSLTIFENQGKRKMKISGQIAIPYKTSKIRNHDDVHDSFKNKYANDASKAKWQKDYVAPSPSFQYSILEEENDSPYKLVKSKAYTDVHNILKDNDGAESSKIRLKSTIVDPFKIPIVPVKTNISTSHKIPESRSQIYDKNDLRNKLDSKSCKPKFQSSAVSPSTNDPISPVKSRRYRNDNKMDFSATENMEGEEHKTKICNFGHKNKSKVCNVVGESRGDDDEDWSENEIIDLRGHIDEPIKKKVINYRNKNSGKCCNADDANRGGEDEDCSENEIKSCTNMELYLRYLRKRKGKFTNGELLFKDPLSIIANKIAPQEQPLFNMENRDRAGTSKQKSQERDFVVKEKTRPKLQKPITRPKIASEVTEKSATKSSAKADNANDTDEIFSSNRLDTFKLLNEHFQKKTAKKRQPVASNVKN